MLANNCFPESYLLDACPTFALNRVSRTLVIVAMVAMVAVEVVVVVLIICLYVFVIFRFPTFNLQKG